MKKESKANKSRPPSITISILSRQREIKFVSVDSDSKNRLPSPRLETEMFLEKARELSMKVDNSGVTSQNLKKLEDLGKRMDSGIYEGLISTAISFSGRIYRTRETNAIRAEEISPQEIKYVVDYVLERANTST